MNKPVDLLAAASRRDSGSWRSAHYVVIALCAIGPLSALFGMFSNSAWNWWVWNADSLGHFTLANDLFQGGDPSSWHLGNNSYLFPDFASAAISLAVTPSLELAIVANALIQIVSLFGVVYYFGRSAGHPNAVLFSAFSVSAISALAATVGEPYALLLASHHHVGAFTGGLLLLSIITAQTQKKRTQMWAVFVTSFLFGLSDDLFIATCAFPIALVVFAFLPDTRHRRASLSILIIASGLGGKALLWMLPPETNPTSTRISLAEIGNRAKGIIDQLIFNPSRLPIVGIVSVVVTLAAIAVTSADLLRRQRCRELAGSKPLVAFLATSAVASTVPLALGAQAQIAERYMISIFFVPIIIASYHFTSTKSPGRYAIATTTVVVLSAAGFLPSNSTTGPWHPWHPDLECVTANLEQAQASNVIAQYWDAHLLGLTTGGSTRFAQYLSSGEPYVQVTSKDWYSDDGWYDAALLSSYAGPIHTFTSDQFVTERGNQVSIAQCGPWAVLSAPNDSVRFRTS